MTKDEITSINTAIKLGDLVVPPMFTVIQITILGMAWDGTILGYDCDCRTAIVEFRAHSSHLRLHIRLDITKWSIVSVPDNAEPFDNWTRIRNAT